MDTVGLLLPVTEMVTAVDVVVAFSLSVTFTVNVCVPTLALLKAKLYGLEISSPNLVAPSKNSTRVIEPLASDAVAVTVIAEPCAKDELLAGAVILPTGNVFEVATCTTGT